MRGTLFAVVAAATGCNWIYGLDPTVAIDAAPPGLDAPEQPKVYSSLAWVIPETDGVGTPDAVLAYYPIGIEPTRPEVPTILVGPPLGVGPLQPAPYNVGTVEGLVGAFEIPFDLRNEPHRIVYTLPGNPVPHEVQLTAAGAKLVVPRFTRLHSLPPPAASGYTMKPIGYPGISGGATDIGRLYTSGSFSAMELLGFFEYSDVNGTRITLPEWPAKAKTFGDRLGTPEPAKGDWVLFMDLDIDATEKYVAKGYALTKIELGDTGPTGPTTEPTWETATIAMSTANASSPLPTFPMSGGKVRMMNALQGLIANEPDDYWIYGMTPSTQVPGIVLGTPPYDFQDPVMVRIAESGIIQFGVTTVDPPLGFERVVYAQYVASRNVGGVNLRSSMQVITNRFSGQSNWAGTFALNIKLGATDLSGPMDAVAIEQSSAPVKLTWSRETTYGADDYVVTLYELGNGKLTPIRHYYVTKESVDIDASQLQLFRTYLFAIRARVGFPGASQADYSVATYPFSMTTTMSRTFEILTE